jgi:hypothetical protein
MIKKYLAKQNVTALEHPPLFPDFPPPNFSMFPRLKVF